MISKCFLSMVEPVRRVTELVGLRSLQISIGIIAALVINHVVYPKHVRVLFLSGMARVLEDVRELYSGLSR